MLDLDARAARAVASPVATPPDLEAIQRRGRSNVGSATHDARVAAGAVIVALGDHRSQRGAIRFRDRLPVEAGNGGAPGVAQPITRPVLDLCTPTRASEGIMTGTGHTDPERDGEVSVPGQGSDGPTAVLLRMPGDTLSQVPNATVAGRPARVDAEPQGEGGITWIVADGTTAIVFSLAPYRSAASRWPKRSPWARLRCRVGWRCSARPPRRPGPGSTCTDDEGFVAAIEVIRGPAADRYARLLAEPAGTHWDEGRPTFLFMERPSANPSRRARCHARARRQATRRSGSPSSTPDARQVRSPAPFRALSPRRIRAVEMTFVNPRALRRRGSGPVPTLDSVRGRDDPSAIARRLDRGEQLERRRDHFRDRCVVDVALGCAPPSASSDVGRGSDR